MRWYVASLACILLLAIMPSVAYAGQWGCCVPPANVCFDSSRFDTQSAFAAACEEAGTPEHAANIVGAGQYYTCTAITQCQIGCCCAGAEVPDRYTINSNEDLLRITFAACEIKSGFSAQSTVPGQSCVQTCTGIAPPPGGGGGGTPSTYTVRGTVVNKTGTNPLQGAQVFLPIPGGEINATTDSQGRFTLQRVPQITTRIFASLTGCQPGQSSPVTVSQDVSNVRIELPCAVQACQHAAPTFSSPPALVRGTSDVSFSVALTDTCQDLVRYEPMRCEAAYVNCQPLTPSTLPTITDTGLAPSTQYCYLVNARWRDGSSTLMPQGTGVCITTGDEQCTSAQARSSWCGSIVDSQTNASRPATISCDNANHATATPCGDRMMCAQQGNAAACVAAPTCEKCNGLLGLFSRVLASLEIPVGLFTRTCSQACVLDSSLSGNPLLVDAYSACMGVGSCTDYHSATACTQNTCGLQGCSWISINAELGQGVCAKQGEVPCDKCDDIFGYCTRQMCTAIGQSPSGNRCYFDELRNSLGTTQGCIAKEQAACRYYDTHDDCVGAAGHNAEYSIQYANEARSGGTNQRTASSSDVLGIGACSWVAASNICVKNADMLGGTEDDCIENERIYTDATCVQDSTPPTTTFLIAPDATFTRVALRSLPYRVADDRTPVDDIETFVCFSSASAPCAYPTHHLSDVPLPLPGTWTLRFYSMDANQNSEVVKEVAVTVFEGGTPAVADVRVEEGASS